MAAAAVLAAANGVELQIKSARGNQGVLTMKNMELSLTNMQVSQARLNAADTAANGSTELSMFCLPPLISANLCLVQYLSGVVWRLLVFEVTIA